MTEAAYPLKHWSTHIQQLSPAVVRAVRHALADSNDSSECTLPDGSRLIRQAGGNHNVAALQVSDQTYCLKLPQPTHRHESNAEHVLRREVGGLCVLADYSPGRAPSPIAWNVSPAWLLTDWLPGIPLGNCSLNPHQLAELAAATQEVAALTPENSSEPLWDIDWNIVWHVQWLRERHGELAERAAEDDVCAEAAALMANWLATGDPSRFLEDGDGKVFTRGDQNLANVIWDEQTIRFVDFEYCGWNDLARDLSLLTEHIQSYATPIEAWETYLDHFGLTKRQRQRTMAGRRRHALSWLAKECLKPGSLHSFPGENRLECVLERARQLCLASGS